MVPSFSSSAAAILLLFLILASSASTTNFTCTGPATCQSAIVYTPPAATTYIELLSSFETTTLRDLFDANGLPPSTPSHTAIPANATVIVPFRCSCVAGANRPESQPFHIIQPNDNMSYIAAQFDDFVTYQEIAAASNISNPDFLEVGQELWIPLPCSCDQVEGNNVTHFAYKVRAADNVSKIAARFGVKESTLLKINGITDPKNLTQGQILDVPVTVQWFRIMTVTGSFNQDDYSLDLRTLQTATNNFDERNRLGEGGFGMVYKRRQSLGIRRWRWGELEQPAAGGIAGGRSAAGEVVRRGGCWRRRHPAPCCLQWEGLSTLRGEKDERDGDRSSGGWRWRRRRSEPLPPKSSRAVAGAVGTLLDGQEIAVKRLSHCSKQGLNELKNELVLVGKLQHKNLVRVLGVCVEKQEKLLVYEYMPNRSLDTFIFDRDKSKELGWEKRFKIIIEIARGLEYLHEESRLKIIHRDLKANNILLDSDLTPKISDFGLAKLFGEDQSHVVTNRVAGTYGYMAPEYAMFGQYSVKSDVFSFGVLILEIITGRRSMGSFNDHEQSFSLLDLIWQHWNSGTILNVVDPSLSRDAGGQLIQRDQLLGCIHVALLCVQENPADRPKLSAVTMMIGGGSNSTASLNPPSRPAFCMHPTDATRTAAGGEPAAASANPQLTLHVHGAGRYASMTAMRRRSPPAWSYRRIHILFLLLLATSSSSASAANFTCTTVQAACQSAIGYTTRNATTYAELLSLFNTSTLAELLRANGLPPTAMPPDTAIPAAATVTVPFRCLCNVATRVGRSDYRPIYLVGSQDGLDAIARKVFDGFVTYQEIADASNIPDPNKIFVGQELWIPLPCSCDQVDGHNVTHFAYKVRTVDTTSAIAAKFGVLESTLMRINGITDPKNQSRGRFLMSQYLVMIQWHEWLGSMKEDINIDLSTLRTATNNFDERNKLGEGGFGVVYKGALPDGQQIAVKSKLQHKNLVRLVGVCVENQEKLLVYEYMPNRSLDTILFDPDKSRELSWEKRLKIIIEIARGLEYLHEESRLKIIHRDLKANNILLDSDLTPKISDFGLANGYMAPEYAMFGQYSVKSDVFSFGVLILEIVTGRRSMGSYSDHEQSFNLLDLADQMLGCIHVGLLCVQANPADRPKLSAVTTMIGGTASLNPPSRPAFWVLPEEDATRAAGTNSSPGGRVMAASANRVSITEIEPR
uniref:Protein kinase domain-containing protein n=1 Tax=Oryza nivara TaxID=4536 RepID=A0A0E0J2Y7_ORYNI